MAKLDKGHWLQENYKQRVTSKEWKELLLKDADQIIFQGRLRPLEAKHLGVGVYEISKAPLKEQE